MDRLKAFVKKNPAFTVFFLLTLGVIAVAVFAPLLATHDPYEAVLADAVQPPSTEPVSYTHLPRIGIPGTEARRKFSVLEKTSPGAACAEKKVALK